MGRIYRFLGLTCEAVNDTKSLAFRRKVFGSVDIVYLTARTLGFSYLGHLTAQAPDEEVCSSLSLPSFVSAGSCWSPGYPDR